MMLFQLFDGGDVEMVGGLVQQKQIGFARERARQGSAPRLAAGERIGGAVGVETESFKRGLGGVG